MHTEQKKEFGAAVKSERIRLGLSQETLAERADLHRTYITDVERGARNLSLETIYKIAAALGVSVGSLFARGQLQEPSELPAGANKLVDVLLIEDNARDVELVLAAFRHACVTNHVHVVRDGAAALDFIFCRRNYSRRRMETNPQLVLLDLNLPKVKGMEVLRRIKEDERTRNLHVVILTSSRQDEDMRAAMDLGADAYLIKPVDFANFSKIAPQLSLKWALLGSTSDGQ
jgi:CheY-like chemotaxis protein